MTKRGSGGDEIADISIYFSGADRADLQARLEYGLRGIVPDTVLAGLVVRLESRSAVEKFEVSGVGVSMEVHHRGEPDSRGDTKLALVTLTWW
jgi:hypothetical protein